MPEYDALIQLVRKRRRKSHFKLFFTMGVNGNPEVVRVPGQATVTVRANDAKLKGNNIFYNNYQYLSRLFVILRHWP